MIGPTVITQSISARKYKDKYGNEWQYHPRSDHHSKTACWAILFDVLQHCPELRAHAADGRVGFGINHQMTDFQTEKRKDLDLVLCIPRTGGESMAGSFAELATHYDLVLDDETQEDLMCLPAIPRAEVGDVLVAVEAKACMTAHSKAAPRFFDELTSAWMCINGSSERAIAVGFSMVNAAEVFVSPLMNKELIAPGAAVVNEHRQPAATQKIQEAFRRLRLRGTSSERGYDAMGMVTVDARNDGSPMTIAPEPLSVPPSDPYEYEMMIRRIASIYSNRFSAL